MATLLLAEAGAEVVKVERPEGEDMRAYPAPWGRDSVYFALLNRGKKSVTLDLKNPVDRAALAPLVARADIIVEQFRPGPQRRLGVLVDHLVPGSKESRLADAVRRSPGGAHTLVVGHPFVDIWQAVKPARLGLAEWPVIPRGVDWKHGVCQALGWPHADSADVAAAWRRIRSRVRDWTDLDAALIGRVEELIDFVTQP